MTVAQPMAGYLFAYFTGDSLDGEAIRFAVSDGNDALHWRALNGGSPVIRSTIGTGGLRDPFLIRSPDGERTFLLATDLSIGGGTTWDDAVRWGSRHIEVWESRDLDSWSPQRHVLVSPANAANTWAPEAIYEEDLGAFVVVWASRLFDLDDLERRGDPHHVMLASTTTDFASFTDPIVWHDPGWSVIDSTIVQADGSFHRFTKDEGGASGCADIIQERSSAVLERSSPATWELVASGIGRGVGLGAVEGPIAFEANPGDVNGQQFFLFVDEYRGRGYVPLVASDVSAPEWRIPVDYRLPAGARHGSIMPITAAELERLTAHAD